MSLDLPEVPPPTPPRPAMSKPKTVVAGCGIAAVAFVVLAIIGGVTAAVFLLPSFLLPRVRADVDHMYAKAKENKNLTEKQLKVYGELADTVDSPFASFYGAMPVAAIVKDHLKDGALTEDEIAEAETLRDFLSANPSPGMFTLNTFMKAHPEIQAKANKYQPPMVIEK